MDKVVYISLEYINIHLLYIMRVLIFMDPDKDCKRSLSGVGKGVREKQMQRIKN